MSLIRLLRKIASVVGFIAAVYFGFTYARQIKRRKLSNLKRTVVSQTKYVKKEAAENTRTRELSTNGLSPRQKNVLQIIKAGNEVEMKDLISQIRDVTERTLRRDLTALEERGMIKKTGKTKSVKYTLN